MVLDQSQKNKVKDSIAKILDKSFDSQPNNGQYPAWQVILVVLEIMGDPDYMGELIIKIKENNCYGIQGTRKLTPGLNSGLTQDIIENVLKN